MPQKDSPDYRAEAKKKWEQTYKHADIPAQDCDALRQLLKETQIAQLALLLENENIKHRVSKEKKATVENLYAILESLPNALFIKDVQDDYRILYWNTYADRLLGTRDMDAIGKTDEDIFPAKKAQAMRNADRAMVEQSLSYSETIVQQDVDKEEGIYRSVIKDEEGEPRFLVGFLTDQQQAGLLSENDRKLKVVFDSASDAILLFVNRKFFDCNECALDMYGLKDKAEFSSLYLSDVSPSYQPSGKASDKLMFRHLRKLRKEGIVRFYWLHTRADGSTFHADVVASIIPYKDEEIIRVVVRDISDQIRHQAEMRKLSLIVQKTDNTVAIINDQALIEWVNEGFEKMTGYAAESALGQHFGKLLGNEHKEQFFKLPDLAEGQTHQSLLYELEGRRKDGTPYWRLTSVTPFIGTNGNVKYIVIESDLTEQKRSLRQHIITNAQQLKRLNEVERLAQVGHWHQDLVNGTEFWSEELYHILRYDSDAIPASRAALMAQVHAEDVNIVEHAQQRLEKGQSSYSITYRLKIRGYEQPYLHERCVATFDNEHRLIALTGIVQDITEQKERELALKRSLKEVQDLTYALDQSSMVVVVDRQKQVISANRLFCKTTQYKEEELIGNPFSMTDPDYHSRWFLEMVWGTAEKGKVWKGELRNKTKGGTVYWANTAIIPFLDDTGIPEQYIILQHDITSQKRIEEELENNNEAEFAKLYHQQQQYIAEVEERSAEWDRFFRFSSEMISVIASDGTIIRINPAFFKALGFKAHEMVGKHVLDFIHPDDQKLTRDVLQNLKDGTDVINYENRWRNYNDEYRWMSWRAVVDQEYRLIYSISRDVTERKIAQQKIEDLAHTLHQTTMVLVLDDREHIISVNNKFCEISGYQRMEVVGKKYSVLHSNYHDDVFWLKLRNTIRSGNIWQGEIREQDKHGQNYWTYTSVVPFINAMGEPSQYIVTQTDITSRKHLEEKLREAKEEADKNAQIKEDFLANMSHEIRTPMNGVLGFSRLLLQTDMNNTQHEYAQSIYSSAENLLVIVNDILDVSKIESGTLRMNEVPFLLKKRIEESLNILRVSVEKKNLEFTINIDSNIPTTILGVPDRIAQVLINLVGNAIKFTKKGKIALHVKLKNKYLIFEVSDTGIGIPEDKLGTIFDSFTQAENYSTREHSGTGLGLSISRKLVNAMGGKIGVESVMGEGSTFYFTLPYKEAQQPEQDSYADLMVGTSSNGHRTPLILIVEDNPVNQELTQIYLNLLECNYHMAYNGEEAIEKVKQNDYDLILLDIQMPKLDGLAATTGIRSFNTHVPIIAMSAHAFEWERERCFEIGMNDYIAKPFKVEGLEHTLEKFIQLPTRKEAVVRPRVRHLNAQDLKEDLVSNKFFSNTEASISRELLQLFKQELNKLTQGMDEALEESDVPRMQKLMHRIKSNFQLLDLMTFYQWSHQMDQLATKDAPIDSIRTVYQQFKEALPELMSQIDTELNA